MQNISELTNERHPQGVCSERFLVSWLFALWLSGGQCSATPFLEKMGIALRPNLKKTRKHQETTKGKGSKGHNLQPHYLASADQHYNLLLIPSLLHLKQQLR